jgi:hypothetical protein
VGDGKDGARVSDDDFTWLEPHEFVDHYRQSPYRQQVLDEIRSHLDDPKGADDDGDNHGTYGDNDGQLPLSKGKKASKYPTPIYKYDRLPITERSPSLSLTRFAHTGNTDC